MPKVVLFGCQVLPISFVWLMPHSYISQLGRQRAMYQQDKLKMLRSFLSDWSSACRRRNAWHRGFDSQLYHILVGGFYDFWFYLVLPNATSHYPYNHPQYSSRTFPNHILTITHPYSSGTFLTSSTAMSNRTLTPGHWRWGKWPPRGGLSSEPEVKPWVSRNEKWEINNQQ